VLLLLLISVYVYVCVYVMHVVFCCIYFLCLLANTVYHYRIYVENHLSDSENFELLWSPQNHLSDSPPLPRGVGVINISSIMVVDNATVHARKKSFFKIVVIFLYLMLLFFSPSS
jgi:hypothetical protein